MADTEKIPSYYASGVGLVVSPWDLTLTFSLREGTDPKDVHPVASVILSPQHAWVFARILRKHIDEYERTFGKIELPPRLLNDLGIED